jgi:hypothetical protein
MPRIVKVAAFANFKSEAVESRSSRLGQLRNLFLLIKDSKLSLQFCFIAIGI